jgi:hypothetical protein
MRRWIHGDESFLSAIRIGASHRGNAVWLPLAAPPQKIPLIAGLCRLWAVATDLKRRGATSIAFNNDAAVVWNNDRVLLYTKRKEI